MEDNMEDKIGLIKISMELAIPTEVIDQGNEKIAGYLNDKLYTDPEFFGLFDEENITVTERDYYS